MTNSGATLKALDKYGTGIADQTYGNQLARLMALNQQGLGATGAQVGAVGQGLTGALNADTQSANMMYGAANTVPQGIIAAQNAQNAGAQNAINLGSQALGMLLGSSFNPFGGGASSFAQGGNYGLNMTGAGTKGPGGFLIGGV